MDISALQSGAAGVGASNPNGFDALAGEDFFKLLIAQLVNQDPLEPTSNQELLQQISSIREIEVNSQLTDMLKSLGEGQQFGTSSSLIGRYVTGAADAEGNAVGGVVSAVRFNPDGTVILQLSSGQELALADLESVTSQEQVAQALIGRFVRGIDAQDGDAGSPVEGIVTGVRAGDGGEVLLELDTGEQVRFADLVSAESSPEEAELTE